MLLVRMKGFEEALCAVCLGSRLQYRIYVQYEGYALV
jgi:hypothetical protein